MKLYFTICLLSMLLLNAAAQSNDFFDLEQAENKISNYAKDMITQDYWVDRFRSDSLFTRGLVQALRLRNSFYYPFNTLTNISICYAPDSSFRIFTWQIEKDYSYYLQKGAIQMRTANGTLKLFPLFDASEFITKPNYIVVDNKNWIGALYYKILLNTYKDKNYYTLLGLDNNNAQSDKKWMDVLWFDEQGAPNFGGDFFSYLSDGIKPEPPVKRFCIEYKKDAHAKLNYDTSFNLILVDHLFSENNNDKDKFSLLPTGDYYEAFKWVNGKWTQTEAQMVNTENNPAIPLPAPIYKRNGTIDDKLLEKELRKIKKEQELGQVKKTK